MSEKVKDPGGGENPEKIISYADKLKTNVRWDQRLKRNILEICLEKSDRDVFTDLNQACVAKLFRSLGIDITNQVEG